VRLNNQQDFQQKLFVHRKGAEIAEGNIFLFSGERPENKKQLCVLRARPVAPVDGTGVSAVKTT